MVFQTLLKMLLDLRIHRTTENCEQAMGIHVLEREITSCCQEFACKELFVFRKCLQLG